jgi:thiamine pyrophosphokinase
MKRCFIFSAGTYYGLREPPVPGDFIIAADAGYRVCQAEGIVPDLLLGDFDSMDQPADFANTVRVPVEKDDTDTMLAVKEGLRRGCDTFFLYGGTGGKRLDHTLANLQSLLYLRQHGAKGNLYDDDFVFTAIQNETLTLSREVEWGLLSVFCIGPEARGIDEQGVQYPLRGASISAGFPLGISNHFLEEEARVTVRDGALLVGWQLAEKGKKRYS